MIGTVFAKGEDPTKTAQSRGREVTCFSDTWGNCRKFQDYLCIPRTARPQSGADPLMVSVTHQGASKHCVGTGHRGNVTRGFPRKGATAQNEIDVHKRAVRSKFPDNVRERTHTCTLHGTLVAGRVSHNMRRWRANEATPRRMIPYGTTFTSSTPCSVMPCNGLGGTVPVTFRLPPLGNCFFL